MTLTKLKSAYPGNFEYVNLEHISYIDVDDGHYSVYLSNGVVVEVDITCSATTALIPA